MLELLRARIAQGRPTIPFPPDDPGFPERFRGTPVIVPDASGRATLDLGACLFSPEEAAAYTHDYRLSARARADLEMSSNEVAPIAALDERMRKLLGRSLRLRSVVAGSCNGCEAELVASSNVVFDLARFGIQFVASPRHADGIVVTGAVNENMRDALRATYAAVADPRIVIAVGACAASGGPFRESRTAGHGVPDDIPVDLWIAGCPPHPLSILHGLLGLLGRLADAGRSGEAIRG